MDNNQPAPPPEWRIVPSTEFARQLRKLDPQIARLITKFLNEEAVKNPKGRGEALRKELSDFWKYRIGDYRVICEIQDTKLIILALRVGHRSTVYEKPLQKPDPELS